MARRSRKGRPTPSPRPAASPSPRPVPGPSPGADAAPAPAAPAARESMRRGYARTEERNAALRAGLAPLGPDERPVALMVAIALAVVLALANLALYAAGMEVDGRRPGVTGVLLFALLMLSAAWGMWRRHYWAVLGFEALLGITIGFAGLSLLVASNVAAVVLCLVILGGGGWLFWKLVRVMARLQAPERVS